MTGGLIAVKLTFKLRINQLSNYVYQPSEFEVFVSRRLNRTAGRIQSGRYEDPEIALYWDIWQNAVASVKGRVERSGDVAQSLVRPDELRALLGAEVVQ